MPDRESFVAAIAANPADDLPRLVFADWLEENGDPDRVEFIRTQIRWHHTTDAEEKKQLDQRAGELFREHWQRWFGPFLQALEPEANLLRWYDFDCASAGRDVNVHRRYQHPSIVTWFTFLNLARGFVSKLGLRVNLWEEKANLPEAFRCEPVDELHLLNALHSRHWNRFTDPVLRRVRRLYLSQRWDWRASAPDSTAFLQDPHLAGMREFSLQTEQDDTVMTRPPLPTAWLEAFVRSPLAYRLTRLCLPNIATDGVRPLCRPGRLHLEELELGGDLNADAVHRLGESELSGSVRELSLNSAQLDNTGVAALAHANWRKLTQLELKENVITAEVLPALASAAFVPQLKWLDLSHNPLFTGEERELGRLEALADTLDPNRLEHLNLTDTGLSQVPDFLAERFGDRVTV